MTSPRRLGPRLVVWLAALGVPAGVVWALLAPPVRLLVVGEHRGVALTTESLHRFDAIAIFVGIGLLIGVLAAVVAWRVRRSRGPAALAALVVGSVLGGGVAAVVGMLVARLRYPNVESPAVGEIVAAAPGLVTPMVLVAQPLAAALAYAFLVSLSGEDDLGVRDDDRGLASSGHGSAA